MPCADCEGIKTEIILNLDQTYTISTQYLGKDIQVFKYSGSFIWDENGGKITLKNDENSNENNQYLVGENKLFKLDIDGNRITGDLAEMDVLKKADNLNTITNKHWKLVELNGKKIPANTDFKKEPHFILNENEAKITGNGGCNNFMGSFTINTDNSIQISKLMSTKMACLSIDYEIDYLLFLEKTTHFNLMGDTLILSNKNLKIEAKFEYNYFN